MRIIITSIFIFITISGIYCQEFLSTASQWKYLKGKSTVPSNWINVDYDDSNWSVGQAPFQYDNGTTGTILSDMKNSYSTIYLRKEVNIAIADSMISDIQAIFCYDDGFRIWINGVVALSVNAPEAAIYNSFAPLSVENVKDTSIISGSKVGLKQGKNIICVQVYNSVISSTDLFFDISLKLSTKIPKAPDAKFDHKGGYYNSKFTLKIESEKPGDTIYYTFDYTDPTTSPTAIKGKSPVSVLINPDTAFKRPATPAIIVRASVMKLGYKNGNPETRTYIFLNKVKTQGYPGGSWPSAPVKQQVFDYNVDSRIVNDSRYKSDFDLAFSTIPTVSVVTDNKNLFDPNIGIYTNALEHGEEWEVPASIEMIDTGNVEQFSNGVGLRIRGGYSRNSWNPKHAFRIFYKEEFGKKKLKFPIYGSEGAKEFDKFDLRCAQNYSWSLYNHTQYTNAQDETCRDIQGIMGQPYTRSRYCQLFLNGMYWGLYEFQERPEANFAETYLGGDKSDYDVIKVAVDNSYNIEATDGTIEKYQLLYDLTQDGFITDEQYYKVQGLNKEGNIDTTLETLVNIDNLIDYMINIFYTGNFDAPLSQFGGGDRSNNMPNNFYAIKNRNSSREGFVFLVHDAEHTFNYVPGEGSNNGVYENRVNLISRGMKSPTIINFTPQWLHYQLSFNAKYKHRFADRAAKYLYNNGIFTAAEVEKVFRARTKQIDMAIIGESARWGDSRYTVLRTKDNDWIPAINNTVSKFINLRTPIVIKQLLDAKLIDSIKFPVVYTNTSEIAVNEYKLTSAIDITLENKNDNGVIYYSLDGTDPMAANGTANSAAKTYIAGSKVNIPYSLKFKSRVLSGTYWSALREIVFTNTLNRENIRFTEIQYFPAESGAFGSKSLEFIELKNIGDVGVDVSGCKLDSAVNYTFPKGTIINPKGFVVIAADISAFELNYFLSPTGRFTGNLSNEGERLVFVDENNTTLIDVKYESTLPWPIQASGSGYTLVPKDANPEKDQSSPDSWKYSTQKFGSPFADDGQFVKPSAITETSVVVHIYPNPVSEKFVIKAMGSNLKSLAVYDIYGRLVYSEQLSTNYLFREYNIKSMAIRRGMYFIILQSDNGKTTNKIMVQ